MTNEIIWLIDRKRQTITARKSDGDQKEKVQTEEYEHVEETKVEYAKI